MGGIDGFIRRCERFEGCRATENNSRSPAGMTTRNATAGSSTALRTMRLSAASLRMTIHM
jgi:hypothetical protein